MRVWAAAAALAALCVLPASAQVTPAPAPAVTPGPAPQQSVNQTKTLRLKTPDAAVRLYGAHCNKLCPFSALFAPAVERDRAAPVPVTNLSAQAVVVSARFVPTNALAMANNPQLALEHMPAAAQAKNLLADQSASVPVAIGDTAEFKLALQSTHLPAGLYTGQLELRAAAEGKSEPVTQIVTIEMRIRDSAIWALLAVVAGLLLGRLAQLVYDPQVMAKVQLLDWVYQLGPQIEQVQGAERDRLWGRLQALRTQLFTRGSDVAALQTALRTLQNDVNTALGVPAPPAVGVAPPAGPAGGGIVATAGAHIRGAFRSINAGIFQALRVLAGVTPVPVQSVYDWLLPFFVLLTLIALTVVFMLQQYGGTGTAETFGAGGLADYAGLFLAGVASEAIAGGLRAVKLH